MYVTIVFRAQTPLTSFNDDEVRRMQIRQNLTYSNKNVNSILGYILTSYHNSAENKLTCLKLHMTNDLK